MILPEGEKAPESLKHIFHMSPTNKRNPFIVSKKSSSFCRWAGNFHSVGYVNKKKVESITLSFQTSFSCLPWMENMLGRHDTTDTVLIRSFLLTVSSLSCTHTLRRPDEFGRNSSHPTSTESTFLSLLNYLRLFLFSLFLRLSVYQTLWEWRILVAGEWKGITRRMWKFLSRLWLFSPS